MTGQRLYVTATVFLIMAGMPMVFCGDDCFSAQAEKESPRLQHKGNKLLTIRAKDLDLFYALRFIADAGNMNVVVGKNVQGTVSFFLKDAEPEKVLHAILDSHNLIHEISDSQVITIKTADADLVHSKAAAQRAMQSYLITTENIKPSLMAKTISYMRNEGIRATANDGLKILFIEGAEEQAKKIIQTLLDIDNDISTQSYPLQYTTVETACGIFADYLSEGIGELKKDEFGNILIVTDRSAVHRTLREIVEAIDIPPPQVCIEAKIVQVVLSDENRWGIDWEVLFDGLEQAELQLPFEAGNEGGRKASLKIASIDETQKVAAVFDFLKTAGSANLLSQPRLTVLNNKKAKILVGENRSYITTTTTVPSGGTSTISEHVNFLEVGVKLYVTPTINRDNIVKMTIKPEVSSVAEIITTSSGNSVPIVQTSEAETEIIAKDNTTVVIGGLIKDEMIETTRTIPILGKIPIIGLLCKNKTNSVRKTELVIFLTPKIERVKKL
ncbi:MAG: type II secretion system protein GspD [Candidatus Omnitrophica bacterium]|nr:type II secretion system protein GspD [Candidatus Omnitrophota bacterium]